MCACLPPRCAECMQLKPPSQLQCTDQHHNLKQVRHKDEHATEDASTSSSEDLKKTVNMFSLTLVLSATHRSKIRTASACLSYYAERETLLDLVHACLLLLQDSAGWQSRDRSLR